MLTATNVSMNVSDDSGNLSSGNTKWDYLIASGRQVLLGKYTSDVTLLGTAIQIGLGFTGIDILADIRDLSHDFGNWKWEWSHAGSTALDLIGVIPVIGALKNADEVGLLIRKGAGGSGAKVGTQYGKNGTVVSHPGTEINWSKTSIHGTDMLAKRGVTKEMAESWKNNGIALEQAGGSKHLFFTPDGAIVLATDGTIVTVIPRKDYDTKYLELSKSLFGK